MDNKNTVLIVDDIPENLQVLSSILSDKGIEISFAMNGKQALESVEYNKPDLILLDISMPEMDGFEVCSILKSKPETKEIPIIFLTARTETEDIIKGFEIGAVDYVTKPFNSTELVSRVFSHLKLKQSGDLIKAQNQELKELNATKDKFFSIISHDLRSPFNSLLMMSNLLVEKFDKFSRDEMFEMLELIQNSSKNLFQLLENLLQWSRTQRGKIDNNPTNVNIKSTVKNVFELHNNQANDKEIELVNNIPDTLSCYMDANLLNTVLRNLISNAIKFSHTGKKVFVEYIGSIDNKETIKVIDSGTGIKPKQLKKLFKIDESFSNKGTANEEGTGLGLLLCKEFLSISNGNISVESKEGEGTEMILQLPKIETSTIKEQDIFK